MGPKVQSVLVVATLASLSLAEARTRCTQPEPGEGIEASARLPGSDTAVPAAALKSRLVLVVKDVDMGTTQPDFPGKAHYNNVTFKVVKCLKGNAPREYPPVRVVVRSFPRKTAESIPQRDRVYLFFLEGQNPNGLNAVKVLRASEENIRATEEALKTVDP